MPALVPRLAKMLSAWPVGSSESGHNTMALLWGTSDAAWKQRLRAVPGDLQTALLAVASGAAGDKVAASAFRLLARIYCRDAYTANYDLRAAMPQRWADIPGLMMRAARLLTGEGSADIMEMPAIMAVMEFVISRAGTDRQPLPASTPPLVAALARALVSYTPAEIPASLVASASWHAATDASERVWADAIAQVPGAVSALVRLVNDDSEGIRLSVGMCVVALSRTWATDAGAWPDGARAAAVAGCIAVLRRGVHRLHEECYATIYGNACSALAVLISSGSWLLGDRGLLRILAAAPDTWDIAASVLCKHDGMHTSATSSSAHLLLFVALQSKTAGPALPANLERLATCPGLVAGAAAVLARELQGGKPASASVNNELVLNLACLLSILIEAGHVTAGQLRDKAPALCLRALRRWKTGEVKLQVEFMTKMCLQELLQGWERQLLEEGRGAGQPGGCQQAAAGS